MKHDKTIELLEEILEWLENDGFIEDIHYDEQSIIDRTKEVLHEVNDSGNYQSGAEAVQARSGHGEAEGSGQVL